MILFFVIIMGGALALALTKQYVAMGTWVLGIRFSQMMEKAFDA